MIKIIKLKFKNKDKELDFFKRIPYFNTLESSGIRYAEMISDLDIAEIEKEQKNESNFEAQEK